MHFKFIFLVAGFLLLTHLATAQNKTTQPVKRNICITSASDSVVLQAGGTTITLLPNGSVFIKASGNSGISIDGGNGDVSIKGRNVNLNASQKINIKATEDATIEGINVTLNAQVNAIVKGTASTTISAEGQTSVKGSLLSLNGGTRAAARVGDPVSVSGTTGTIVNGCPTVLISD